MYNKYTTSASYCQYYPCDIPGLYLRSSKAVADTRSSLIKSPLGNLRNFETVMQPLAILCSLEIKSIVRTEGIQEAASIVAGYGGKPLSIRVTEGDPLFPLLVVKMLDQPQVPYKN